MPRPCIPRLLTIVGLLSVGLVVSADTYKVPRGRGHTGEWRGEADTYEDLNIYYRCITRGVLGSIIPVIYGNGNEIVQAPALASRPYTS